MSNFISLNDFDVHLPENVDITFNSNSVNIHVPMSVTDVEYFRLEESVHEALVHLNEDEPETVVIKTETGAENVFSGVTHLMLDVPISGRGFRFEFSTHKQLEV